MGPGVPIQAKSAGGSVTAWCWILVDSGRFSAKTIRGLGLKMFSPEATNYMHMYLRNY